MQETSLDLLVHIRCFLNDTEEALSESISTALELILFMDDIQKRAAPTIFRSLQPR